MWERWNSYTLEDGFNPGWMNSFNHYAYGAIGQFMYERIAGIKPLEAGYKEILIAPLKGGQLSSAKASYESPYGLIQSEWKMENGTFILKTTIPPNTKANVIVPADTTKELMIDGKPFSENSNIKLLEKQDNAFKFEAQPGTYAFQSKLN